MNSASTPSPISIGKEKLEQFSRTPEATVANPNFTAQENASFLGKKRTRHQLVVLERTVPLDNVTLTTAGITKRFTTYR
jgi:hypothetical protein